MRIFVLFLLVLFNGLSYGESTQAALPENIKSLQDLLESVKGDGLRENAINKKT